MQAPTPHPAFPLGKTLAVMTAVAAAVVLIELAAVPAMFGKPAGAVEAVALMGVVVWLSGLVAVLPVKGSPKRGPMGVIAAYFKGMGIRWVAALAMMVVAIKSMKLPAGPVAVSLTVTSFAMMATEVAILRSFLNRFDAPASPDVNGKSNPAPAGEPPKATDDDTTAAPCVEVLA